MKILILGGFGFFGKHIATYLKEEGHEVIALSRRNGCDLTSYSQAQQALEAIKPDVIYNCAAHVGGLPYVAEHHATIAHDNIQMALNLYKTISKVIPKALVINPISNAAYPGEAELYAETDFLEGDVHPSVCSYGNARRTLYALSRCYEQEYGIRTYNFLIPNTFGPGDSIDPNRVHALNGMIIRMIQTHRNGEKEFPVWGTGKPIREWIYIDDVAKLMSLALHASIAPIQPLNFAQQQGVSIQESAESIARAVGFQGNLVFQTEYCDGAPKKILDARRFRQVFPDYQFTDHYAGIQETVAYYDEILVS